MNDTTPTVKPALYVGTYNKYNNGSIAGAWLTLSDYANKESFLLACARIHKDESDPEFMFQDFEGFPKEFYSESYIHDKLFDYVNMDYRDREMVDEYLEATGYSVNDIEFDQIEDLLFCKLDDRYFNYDTAMGNYVVDEGLMDIPENIMPYIDWERLGRDWLMDMSISSNGWVFNHE